jgi:hypothetical protein
MSRLQAADTLAIVRFFVVATGLLALLVLVAPVHG